MFNILCPESRWQVIVIMILDQRTYITIYLKKALPQLALLFKLSDHTAIKVVFNSVI